MKKSGTFRLVITLLAALKIVSFAAADFTWSGQYRIEGQQIFGPALASEEEKTYAVQHLVLTPKIVMADGVDVRARFDIFNNADYADSTMGEYFGSGRADQTTMPNTLGQTQESEDLKVSQLYLTHVGEYGALLAGRVPLQFGLGMSYSAGNGAFDHWQSTRDMVGYKIVVGNFSFTPGYAKFKEGVLSSPSDDVSAWIMRLDYISPENDLEMGLLYEAREASLAGNDTLMSGATPPFQVIGGASATITGKYAVSQINLYFKRKLTSFTIAGEAGFTNGNTGISNSANETVSMNGFGVALEATYQPAGSNWLTQLNLGYATGDDPSTADSYEGFIFNRNYDVAFLLMNYPLGKADVFATRLIGSQNDLVGNKQTGADIDAISNVMYIAPKMTYAFGPRWSTSGSLTYAQLMNEQITDGTTVFDVDNSVGMEVDLSLNFKPNDRIQWINELGYFMPGAAFEGGSTNNFDTDAVYGFRTKAAINF